MTFFSPSKPQKPTPPPQRGERGSRTRRSTLSAEDEAKKIAAEKGVRWRERPNKKAGLTQRGFLCGDITRGFYDLDGKYCRRRGRKVIIEQFGPHAALRALTEEDRARVMRARERGKPSRAHMKPQPQKRIDQ